MKAFRSLQITFLSVLVMIIPWAASANDGEIKANLESLPVELVSEVMSYLPLEDLSRFIATKKVFLAVGEVHSIWHSACIQVGMKGCQWKWQYLKAADLPEEFYKMSEQIQNTTLEDLPGLTWRDLYILMQKLNYSHEKFRRIEGRSLEGGALSAIGTSVLASATATAVGVPALLFGGAVGQASGVACLFLAVPTILVPPVSACLATVGVASIVGGTMIQAISCAVPGIGFVSGFIEYKARQEMKIRRYERKSNQKTWDAMVQQCRDLDIPVPAILKTCDHAGYVDE